MKVALVHDYIKEYGGAERVLEALYEIWPDAPIFTTVYLPQFLGPHRVRFKNWNIKTSFLQYLPFKEKLISPFRLIAPWVFRQFDFGEFDVVIVSATGAYNPNVVAYGKWHMENSSYAISHKPVYITYCHTPPRYLYGYATAREWKNNLIFKILGEIANHFLRLIDFKSSQNVDFFIANSENVKKRIEKFYRRESTVIYPPIEISNSKFQNTNKFQIPNSKIQNTEYFLAGGRLARPKHIYLIVATFAKLKLPLKVFGRGFAGYRQESMGNGKWEMGNIEFLGEVSDEEKLELMAQAKAFIFAAEDEDFGITPVEAMSVGTPVIAYRSGGVVESVIDEKTGIFYSFNDLNHLSEAIRKFDKMKFDREAIINHAQKFSKERFKKEILTYITKVL